MEQEHEQDHALMWVLNDENGPGRFKWACELLGLSHHAVREAVMGELRRTKAEQSAGMGRTAFDTGLEIDHQFDHADMWVCGQNADIHG